MMERQDQCFQELSFGAGVNLKVFEDFENDTANGTRVWEAGVLLNKYLELDEGFRGKKVLELGAGTGVTGLMLAKRDCDVTACDNNDLVVDLLKKNVTSNGVEDKMKGLLIHCVLFRLRIFVSASF